MSNIVYEVYDKSENGHSSYAFSKKVALQIATTMLDNSQCSAITKHDNVLSLLESKDKDYIEIVKLFRYLVNWYSGLENVYHPNLNDHDYKLLKTLIDEETLNTIANKALEY